MKKILTILSLAIFALSILSCADSTQKSNTNQKTEKLTDSYDWEYIFVKDDKCEHEEAYQCAHVMLDFPVFKEDHMSKPNMFINHYITDLVGYGDAESNTLIDLNEVASQLIKDYQNFKSPALGSPQLWHVRLKSKFTYNQDNLLCLLLVSESFMGGAHASLNKRYMTFNSEEGKVVDLLNRIGDKAQFLTLAEQKFRKLKKMPSDADLNAAGYQFPNDQFVLPANIGIDEKGYLLHYNTYEIAPYNMGPTDLRIGFDEIK